MNRIGLIQVALGGYRRAFLEDLLERTGYTVTVAAGDCHLDPTVKTTVPEKLVSKHLRNHFLLGRRIVFQHGYRQALKQADIWVLELNPRILNTWTALVEARLRRKRAVVWGHFTGRRIHDEHPRLLRRLQILLSSGVMAYTYEEAKKFQLYTTRPATVVPNSLERSRDLPVPSDGPRTDFVYIGRFVESKNVQVLVDGFLHARQSSMLPETARLVLVGEGPLKEPLSTVIEDLPTDVHIVLQEGTFDASALNSAYQSAVAGVCGGYVGLSLTQSLSRGTPFLYPQRAEHAPEIALALPGTNAYPFEPGTAQAVATAMQAAWQKEERGAIDHLSIQAVTLSRYCVEAMVEGFLDAASKPPPPSAPTRPVHHRLRSVQSIVHRARFLMLYARSGFSITSNGTPITAAGIKIVPSARVALGRNVALGRRMYVEVDLDVGDDVLFSAYVAVVGNVHPIDGPGTVFASVERADQRVIVEGDNLIGYGATLIAPCHLRRGAVVGAGAVATGELLEDTIYVGVPARAQRRRRRGTA